MWPRETGPGTNGPSSFTRNHWPNSPVVRESAPYPGDWRLECNPLFNSAFHNMQPLGCTIAGPIKTQPFGCITARDCSCVEAIRWADSVAFYPRPAAAVQRQGSKSQI